MASGGKRRRRRGSIFGDGVNAVTQVMTYGTAGYEEGKGFGEGYAVTETKRGIKDVTGVTKSERDNAKLMKDQNKFMKGMSDDIARSRDEANAAKAAELAQNEKDDNRRSARNRQKLKARGSQGRKSTILTGGTNLGESNVARKTLLGQ